MTKQQKIVSISVGMGQNPAAELERIYQQILEQQMQGLPVVNSALKVEAIDFIEWEGHWLGILLTPWFMNLLVIPKLGSPWPEMKSAKGNEVKLSFPQGDYTFKPRDDEGFGPYLCCSLASPVHEWKSHLEARNTAREVMRLLKILPVRQIEDEVVNVRADADAQACPASECGVSRRGFLSGGSRV